MRILKSTKREAGKRDAVFLHSARTGLPSVTRTMAARYREVIWAESAQAALDEVIAYIAKDSPDGARRVLSQALDAAASLSTLSERGRVVPEFNDLSIREVFVFRLD